MKTESNLRKRLWNRLTPCSLKHLTIRRQTFSFNKIYQGINSYILKYINELWGKKLLENQFLRQTLRVWLLCQKLIHLTIRLQKKKCFFLFK